VSDEPIFFESGQDSPLGLDVEVLVRACCRFAAGVAGAGDEVLAGASAGVVAEASGDLAAVVVAGLVPATCAAAGSVEVAIVPAWAVSAIGSTWASGVVGLTVPTGSAGSAGGVGAYAMSGQRFGAGVVDTDISIIGASSVPPSTGSRRHQFGMLHHMRR
jgi:hypothetical protein